LYKKHGRYDKDVESANNNEKKFATQFYNFMSKHPDIIISQVSVPQINLDIVSSPDHQRYRVGDIKEPTPCTLLYVKGRMLRTIKVVDVVVMLLV
jgi:hypothetical protein